MMSSVFGIRVEAGSIDEMGLLAYQVMPKLMQDEVFVRVQLFVFKIWIVRAPKVFFQVNMSNQT